MSASDGVPKSSPAKTTKVAGEPQDPARAQVKREALPPASAAQVQKGPSSQQVAHMVAGAADHQKGKAASRGRGKVKASSDSATATEKGDMAVASASLSSSSASSGAVNKKAKLAHSSDSSLPALYTSVSQIFGPLPKEGMTLEEVAQFVFQNLNVRLNQPRHFTIEEIGVLHALLFSAPLEMICRPNIQVIDPVNPHPAYVIDLLHQSVSRLPKTCRETRKEYLAQYAAVKSMLTQVSFALRPGVFAQLDKSQPRISQLFKGMPVFTTRELFDSGNKNPAYVLRDSSHESSWIFKPVSRTLRPEEQAAYEKAGAPGGKQKTYSSGEVHSQNELIEQMASRVSRGTPIPVPFTVLVDIHGDQGSAQLFVKGDDIAVTPAILDNPNFARQVQAMLVFDLLFANCDRHKGNLLVKEVGGQPTLFAIDHDACVQPHSGKPLKLEYKDYLRGNSLEPEVQALLSPAAIAKYKAELAALDVEGATGLNGWMDTVVEHLQNPDNKPLATLVRELEGAYKTMYGIE